MAKGMSNAISAPCLSRPRFVSQRGAGRSKPFCLDYAAITPIASLQSFTILDFRYDSDTDGGRTELKHHIGNMLAASSFPFYAKQFRNHDAALVNIERFQPPHLCTH